MNALEKHQLSENLRWMFIERLSQVDIEDVPRNLKKEAVADFIKHWNDGKPLELTEDEIDRIYQNAEMSVAYP